ncbi:glycosyltransferase family 4 protein [Flavobacterium sp. NRK F10]|uniref:glycosyltransferase family 4 protein n=1 Tax=Flavobacterium sp. NRK F10 TaxID=2954931 RepID=UPI002091D582|nr:glycosyltransferase family 1 protein [Flavobacterium sp. NRK F10]MCO6174796.1 glycosyltransferase family 4 protein [Flavobacterium sp. NRK F10]
MNNERRLRIMVDCHKFDEDYQGITTYIEGLYKKLVEQEAIVFYFAARNINKLKETFGEKENIKYIKLNYRNKWLRLLIDFPRIITLHKIDFAHFQYIVPPFKFCKYINTIHDVLFLDYPVFFNRKYILKNKFLFKASSKLSDVVLTVSNYSKERIISNFKLNKPVFVTPNAVNEVYYQKYNKEEIQTNLNKKYNLQKYFLLVSRIEPRKNHLLLLKTFVEKAYYKDYDLVFVGKKDLDYKELEVFLSNQTKEVKEKIYFFNHVNNTELLDLIRGAELSVYPSLAEGFGIPPLETLAANIPTVCSNTTAMKDFSFLKEYQFNPEDSNDLAGKIDFALHNKGILPLIKEMKTKYNWETSANKYLEAIRFKNPN